MTRVLSVLLPLAVAAGLCLGCAQPTLPEIGVTPPEGWTFLERQEAHDGSYVYMSMISPDRECYIGIACHVEAKLPKSAQVEVLRGIDGRFHDGQRIIADQDSSTYLVTPDGRTSLIMHFSRSGEDGLLYYHEVRSSASLRRYLVSFGSWSDKFDATCQPLLWSTIDRAICR